MAKRFSIVCVVALIAGLGAAGSGFAQVVADRAALNALLGAGAVTEGFETFAIAPAASTGVTQVLDSTTVTNGQGPNLVVPGVTFTSTTATNQWDGQGYYGLPSKALTANGKPMVIDFATPSAAFGLDLLQYQGYPDTATVTVYGPDRATVLYTSPGIGVAGPTPVFFGYQASGGIGRVAVTGSAAFWAPLIDNVTFGAQVQEAVPTLTLAGLAVLALALGLAGAAFLRTRLAA